jgi:hypothetical protein
VEAARLLNLYTKYNSRVTPELLNDKTFSLAHYNEFETALADYKTLALDAFRLYNFLPAAYRDAFDELVLFPINAVCNLYEMYYAVARNKQLAAERDPRANAYADRVKACFERDSLLTIHYNQEIADGKWAHQMDQVRIGYRYWQQPPRNILPAVEYVDRKAEDAIFVEKEGYVSMEAHHFTRSEGTEQIHWEIIPDLGRTGSSVSTFPANVYPQAGDAIYLEYDFQCESVGEVEVQLFLAPTLNFNANKGLRYALSFDGGTETIVNFNGHYDGSLGRWQGERIIQSPTKMMLAAAGRHTLRIRVLEPGIVLEKVLLDFGGLQSSYLGAPETVAYGVEVAPEVAP